MLQRRYKVIAFDLDGTLVDSMGDFTLVAAQVMQKYFGVSIEQGVSDYKRTSGLPFRFQLQSLYPDHPHLSQAEEDFEIKKLETYETRGYFDDVLPALSRLKKAGYLLSVSSNNHIENVLKKVNCDTQHARHFTEILGYRPGFLKGAPHFDFLKNKYECVAQEILFVGDSLHDARMAHDNGISFVARIGTFKEEDFTSLGIPYCGITDLDGLCDHLGI